MVVREDGPFDVFTRIREAVGADDADWSELGTLGKMFQCPYCLSVWFALVLQVLFYLSKPLYSMVVVSLYGSAVTALIEDYYASNVNS